MKNTTRKFRKFIEDTEQTQFVFTDYTGFTYRTAPLWRVWLQKLLGWMWWSRHHCAECNGIMHFTHYACCSKHYPDIFV